MTNTISAWSQKQNRVNINAFISIDVTPYLNDRISHCGALYHCRRIEAETESQLFMEDSGAGLGEDGVFLKDMNLQCNQGLCQITGQRHHKARFNPGLRERSPIILIILSHGANSDVQRQH